MKEISLLVAPCSADEEPEAELPVAPCYRLGKFTSPGYAYMQGFCHNILIQKKEQTSKNQCQLRTLLKLCSQSLSDFIFEPLMVIIQINPKGSPVLCLVWMVELKEVPVSSMEIWSFMPPRDFLEELNQFDFY